MKVNRVFLFHIVQTSKPENKSFLFVKRSKGQITKKSLTIIKMEIMLAASDVAN